MNFTEIEDYLRDSASCASSDGIVDGVSEKRLLEAANWINHAVMLLARSRAHVDKVLYGAICQHLGVRDDWEDR